MEAVELRYVQPNDVREWWTTIKPGVERVLEKQKLGAIAEDVYMALRNGAAQLFVGLVANRYQSFVVCMKEERVDGSALFVWLSYSPLPDVAGLFFPKLREIAKQGGMKKLRFASNRKGWERRCADYGFKPLATIYEADV